MLLCSLERDDQQSLHYSCTLFIQRRINTIQLLFIGFKLGKLIRYMKSDDLDESKDIISMNESKVQRMNLKYKENLKTLI